MDKPRTSIRFWACVIVAWVMLVMVSLRTHLDDTGPSWSLSHFKIQPVALSHPAMRTIVSAYFPFEVAKHSQAEYLKNMRNFFGKVDAPIMMYTTPEYVPIIEEMRKGMTYPIQFKTFSDIWQVPLAAMFAGTLREQIRIDPESFRHSPELYAVWDSKAWFLHDAATNNPFHSTYFFWVDAGCFRDEHRLRLWPDVTRVQSVFSRYPDRLLFGAISDALWKSDKDTHRREDGPLAADIIEGTFMGGNAVAIAWLYRTMVDHMGAYAQSGFFIGKDQELYNIIAATHPDKVMLLDATHPGQACGDQWFYFRYFLAHPSEKPVACAYQPVRLLDTPEVLRV